MENCSRMRQTKIQAMGWPSQQSTTGWFPLRSNTRSRGQLPTQGHSSLNLTTFLQSGNYLNTTDELESLQGLVRRCQMSDLPGRVL